MRNLIRLNHGSFMPSSDSYPGMHLYTSSFDLVSDSITCVLGAAEIGVIEVKQYTRDSVVNLLGSFCIQSFDDKLLSFVHFEDVNQLVFVFEQGDIMIAKYDPVTFSADSRSVEIVGSIDQGILAAQWSHDEETLVLVTNDKMVLLLSRQFEPICESRMELDDLKMSKHVNVGWGNKETQFRGKGARAMEREALKSLKASGLVGNELRDPTMPYTVDSGIITEFDDRSVSISWRGNCDYFAVSTIDTVADPVDKTKTIERRVIRVYRRDGTLSSVSEPVDFLEQNICWKPQGSLIASIRRNIHVPEDQSLEVAFFERNGLRHGGFDTRISVEQPIHSLVWNVSSEILTIVLKDRIQLWTTKNYHWYLKQEISANSVRHVKWHPEKEFTLMYEDDKSVHVVDLYYKMIQGSTVEFHDTGMSLVIDGHTVNITPFGIANVPPPMSYRKFDCPNNVLDSAISVSNEVYAAINENALVVASVSSLDAMRNGEQPEINFILEKNHFANELDSFRQVAFIGNEIVGVLLDSFGLSHIALIDIRDLTNPFLVTMVETHSKVILLRSNIEYNTLVFETSDAKIVQVTETGETRDLIQFPCLVTDFRVKTFKPNLDNDQWDSASSIVSFGLTSSGKLYANQTQIASAITSMEVTDSLLLLTTAHHFLQMVHLNSAELKPLPIVEGDISDERVRPIERGSILVNVNPTNFAVILQAPRGNLETIYPRIMTLAKVRKNILCKKYMDAFVICRTNRIDLDLLHDYCPDKFYENLEDFINQIERVDYLNLFISCLREEDVTKIKYRETSEDSSDAAFHVALPPPTEMELYIQKKHDTKTSTKVNKICKAFLQILLINQTYKKKYLQTIITSYACQTPPNVSDALLLIEGLSNEETKDSSITYLCFLQDVNVVYKVALSLYNVGLSLTVAQKSQMDPREYIPFLQKLHDLEPLRRKFLIDDYLGNHTKALEHLSAMDDSAEILSRELLDYVEKYKMYKHALMIYRYESKKQEIIYHIQAKYLLSKQEYFEAGMVYEFLGDWNNAMDAYILGIKWTEALSVATQKFPERIKEVSQTLVSSLVAEHKYDSAAHIELNFLKNIKNSILLFCKAYAYDEAILTCGISKRFELVAEVVDPALGEGFSAISELLADCKGQVNSQLKRLRELRTKKEQDPFVFYGQETEQGDDVSIAASETSTKESFFTRYTGNSSGTVNTGVSRKTIKNKRREERKRARGKKGTIYEEEYLVNSIGRLLDRLHQNQPYAVALINGLLRRNMRAQAYEIQKSFVNLISLLKEHIVEIYTISEKDRERIDENGQVYYLPKIPIPEIKPFPVREIIDY